MAATTTMYVGLGMTSASSFQMLRGALIVFTGILTILVLKRKLKSFQWLGIFVIITGLAVVGSNDFLKTKDVSDDEETGHTGASTMITGDVLIILAQVLTAFQMIIEEKFLRGEFDERSNPTLVANSLFRFSLKIRQKHSTATGSRL